MALLLLVGLTACATPIQTEYDRDIAFSDYQTFAWKVPSREGVEDPAGDSEILDRRMARLISDALEARGYESVPAEEADFLITYRTTTRRGDRSSGSSISIGMGSGNVGGGVRLGGGGSQTQSVLMLDIIDRSDDTLVWRGWEESQQGQSRWSEDRLKRLVNRLLNEFPPSNQ
ncbi:hypothetical protein J2T60_002447 [Natronospira proteinivora]|uniref:DUF4136 domain-containing protein n=1 Tax=Natronospira proteinivora TaxID=1807133 RepID=A0ABT1GAW6_9GAMM|nr:DUF4136 domain-containing protein [Natronospira proteinivora]MCP1728447.1 hypothetical protein [Natronospira proteinivora]